jgi:hypothetical protein
MPGGSGSALPYHALGSSSSGSLRGPNRPYVRLFSWFGLVLGGLHLLGGSLLGLAQMCISATGIYATWSDTRTRPQAVGLFAAGWIAWAVVESLYLAIVIAALTDAGSHFIVGAITATTFPNVADSLHSLFVALRKDVGVFVVFSAVTAILFDWLAAYFGVALWTEIASTSVAGSSALLVRHGEPTRPPGIMGFGSLGQTSPAGNAQTPLRVVPFKGRGNRLGNE